MDADIYYKKSGRYYVGYKNENGKYSIYKKDGLLRFFGDEGMDRKDPGTLLYKVNLYEDVSGKYFPTLGDEDSFYKKRKDGRIERIEVTGDGSRGKIVKDHRDEIQKSRSRYA